jgi:hypothetical protein
MFLQFADQFSGGPAQLFSVSGTQLSRWLDEAWAKAGFIPPILTELQTAPFLGDHDIVEDEKLPDDLRASLPSGINVADPNAFGTNVYGAGPLIWDHLVYAYLIESTGVFEIFAEVVRRLLVGETLVTLSRESTQWLRATEELFFKDPPLFAINGVVSEVRPRARVNRRNAYWRMFGMDLPHPIPGRWGSSSDTAWKLDVGPGVNADFRPKWTELLRQIWLGIEQKSNTSGANPADPTFIVLLCEALRDMMNNRRRGGQLAREEFSYVAALSWFHLTVNTDTPIIRDLQAIASSPADRLAAVGNRVGMSPAARSRELFDLAQPMSRILRAIELRLFKTPIDASQFYVDPTLSRDVTSVIDNWQSATGERVKERPVGTVPVAQPLRVPTPARLNGASLNGARG